MTWKEYHASSERFAALAQERRRVGWVEEARKLYRKASYMERWALYAVPDGCKRMRGILAVSAVALLRKGADWYGVRILVDEFLEECDLPRWAELQLLNLNMNVELNDGA